MKVVLFAGAALVGATAVFGAIRASQEATPVVVAKSKEVIRQVTQAELVDQLTAELKGLRARYAEEMAAAEQRLADALSRKEALLESSDKLTEEVHRLRDELTAEVKHRKEVAAAVADLRYKATMLALELDEARGQVAAE